VAFESGIILLPLGRMKEGVIPLIESDAFE